MENATGQEADLLGLERLYHRMCVDEIVGIKLLQEMAEESIRYRLIYRLRTLLTDANTYPVERDNSRLWWEYYQARTLHLEGEEGAAAEDYERIIGEQCVESPLRAYALADLGYIWIHLHFDPSSADKAIQLLEESHTLLPRSDPKLNAVYEQLSWIYLSMKHDPAKSLLYAKQFQQWADECGDIWSILQAYANLKFLYRLFGNWHEMLSGPKMGWQRSERALIVNTYAYGLELMTFGISLI